MTAKTHILGKDAALEDTIAKAQALLTTHGFPVDLVSSKNPVRNCWSVHLRSAECPQIYTNGKGGSKLASEASAILEFFERLSTNLFFFDFYLGNAPENSFVFYPAEKWFPIDAPAAIPTHHPDGTELLNETLRTFYNPEGELLPSQLLDNNTDQPDRGIAALPFECMETKETVYFPVSILTNLYVSNGMAAGNTPTECRAQALAEIMERYVKNQIIAEGICLPDVPQSVLDRFPRIQADIDELNEHGFPIMVKDASLDGQFPVICVLLINPKDGGCYASFGASCRFEVALERTVTELLQGRGLDQLDIFERPSHDLDAVADGLNLESHFIDSVGLLSWKMFGNQPDHAFNDWDFQGTTAEEYAHLMSIINRLGFSAYCAEYPHCGVYTCRIIVPGMSDIYPAEDLIWSSKTTGASLRPELLKLNQMSVDELNGFTEKLEELGLSDVQPLSDAIGVIFEEGTAWHSLRIGELKGMLSLATGNLKEAAQWCSWCQHFDSLPPARQTLYRAIHELVNFGLTGENPGVYDANLGLFFDEQTLADARNIIAGKLTFHGLRFAESWEAVSPAHQNFMAIYNRLRPLKTA
ncbi:30S ribosomal protein S12 methylthiotransferase accessory factor YcaO [Pontiella sulfatireligans]|uniref:Ribosomal protein S12 methylthiotransferase accessory factor YcaO n=1 Tax=Pontiella sulfatireligans TaxID=2750658 RepID=A0A6C2UPT3_9BACT|nr:30S ribosomal protein S12 methylthiotransferase accessory factor YcaO [Pontiella sulfatireligans]VGO22218.1 Ribosomal protein S12 methylthiotransferase accessory factor YcaO [Pontiella sulfatireligans]